MKFIRAGSRCDIYDSTRSPPVLGCKVAGHDAELLNGIERNFNSNIAGELIIVCHTIKQDVRRRRSYSVDSDTGAAPARIGVGGVPNWLNEILRAARQAR